MISNKILLLTALVFLSSCIGTDIVLGPSGTEKLEIAPKEIALLISQTAQITIEYTNPFGEIVSITPDYISATPSIIGVDESGLVTALSEGKGKIYASFEDIISDTAIINVVGSEDDVAKVTITGTESNLDIGETATLTASAFTINDSPVSTNFVWSSLDTEIATVNTDGLVTGIGRGSTEIIATSNGVDGTYPISVGLTSAKATFMGSSGYVAKGMAELSLVDGNVTLMLSNDFETSFALGTFIYLANSVNGAMVKANGLNLGEIKMNGSHTFDVTTIAEAMNKSVSIGAYKYVVVLCEPASLTFGYGELTF